MRYVFRADASLQIGSGHVMRISAIAEEMIARGLSTFFVGEISDLPWVRERIQNLGFSGLATDPLTFEINSKTDVLIFDSHTLELGDYFLNLDLWHGVVAIVDDSTPPYLSNLKIKIDLFENLQLDSKSTVLSGPTYFPLRKDIQKLLTPKTENPILQILIIGGGTDIHGFAEEMCKNLEEFKDRLEVRVFTNKELRIPLAKEFRVSPIGPELDRFASVCDLAFTTASTTAVEFIAREKAIGIVCAVNNQEQFYESLVNLRIAAPIGKFENGTWNLDLENIRELIISKESRAVLRRNCVGFIDFEGASRIVDEILLL